MFCWRCILIYPYNKNQLDALFNHYSLRQPPLHARGSYCPSSGGITAYIPQSVRVIPFSSTYHTYKMLHIYSDTSWWWAITGMKHVEVIEEVNWGQKVHYVVFIIWISLIILQRMSHCVYDLTTNHYSPVQHNYVFNPGIPTCFGLKRPSSVNHYKKMK
jgi:hypothetical protein